MAARLAPAQREAIVRLRADGLTLPAIAAQTGASVSSCKRVLGRVTDEELERAGPIDVIAELERAVRAAKPGSLAHVRALVELDKHRRLPAPPPKPDPHAGPKITVFGGDLPE